MFVHRTTKSAPAAFHKGVRALLATVDDIEVVGLAQSGPEAVAACASLRPDLVPLDLQMPAGGGLEALPEIRRAAPDASVLVLTMRADDVAVREALRLGAHGYLLKDSEADDFLRPVTAVGRGDAYVGREVAGQLASPLAPDAAPVAFPELTTRERDVLRLTARGSSNAQIAGSLHLTTKSVQNYVSRISVKLGVADRPRAIVLACEAELHLGEG